MRSVASILTPEGADFRVRYMKPGQSFVYYQGMLAVDRDTLGKRGAEATRAKEVGALADMMMRHGRAGDHVVNGVVSGGLNSGSLSQRRLGEGVYEYIFTKH